MKTEKPTCKTCEYWYKSEKQNYIDGECRRRSKIEYGWFSTDAEDWCGEHHLFDEYLSNLEEE